jgi:VanZ family protein
MRYLNFGYLLQFVGTAAILYSFLVDLVGRSTHGYGKMQLAGTVIGIFIILVGIRETVAPKCVTWNRLLLLFYVAGIIFMGLGPEAFKVDPSQPILGRNAFSLRDFFINLFGFLPLGYLVISNLAMYKTISASQKITTLAMIALLVGVSFSLVIETSQHFFIPGRFSSLYDILGNGFGTFLGIYLYFFGRKWNSHIDKQTTITK